MSTEVLKILLLHFILLASQAFYMYLSNKTQLKRNRNLYFIALLPVLALPVLYILRDPSAYPVYEYAVVFCMIAAALADTVYAAACNKEFFTDQTIRSLHYSYFVICMAVSFCRGTGMLIKAVTAAILAAVVCWSCVLKKHSPAEFAKAAALALCSFACSLTFVTYVI